MSSIPPLPTPLLSPDTTIEVKGTLGHRQVEFINSGETVTYPLTQVLDAIKNTGTPQDSAQRTLLNERVRAIQEQCNISDVSSSVLDACKGLLDAETMQQAQEINEQKISLLVYFGSIENVDIQALLRLTPHLQHVDLTGIEEKIEAQVEGGIEEFLRKCPEMTHLRVSNATQLYCRDCTALTSIDAPNATYLSCSACPALTSIVAPKATRLYCSGCTALTSIDTPNATKLDCLACPALTSIVAPNATYLDCSGCTVLISIDAPKATYLKCYDCETLTSIDAPKAEILDCSGCTELTSIDAPNATELDCLACPALTSITAPKAEFINCSGCTELTSIDAPRLLSLNSTNCWFLQELTAPKLISTIEIQKEEMKERPEKYLSQLIPYFLVNKQWPLVEFIETDGGKSPGIDASGLRKDAQTTLVQAFCSEGKSTLKVDKELKPLLEVNEEGKPKRPEDLLKWRALGYIMGAAFKENFPTGRIFSPKVFETLKAAVWLDRDENFKMALFQTLFKEEAAQYEDIEGFDDLLKEFIPKLIEPIIALADGIKAILNEEELATFADLEPSAIQDRIEGTLSADAILEKLEIRTEVSAEVQEFLRTWIRNRADNPEALKAFLIAVTGSPTISPQMPTIKILHRADGLPASHTCFNQLELSNVPTQEKFDEDMAEFLATAQEGSGFTEE